MKKTLYSVFLLFLSTCVSAQIDSKFTSSNTFLPCGQNAVLQKMQEEEPEKYQSYMQARSSQAETFPSMEKSGVIYTIPVVFHILHNNGTENISNAQIEDALFILNRDFRKQNADVNNVVAQFLPLAADIEFQFEFATIAPNGACFNGITRTVSNLTNNGSSGQNQVNAIISGNNVYNGVWPHNKYLNIYVCKSLVSGAAGYTFHPNNEGMGTAGAPATAVNMYYNGIFMLHNYTGSIGTSSVGTSRALTHEVGHWFGLDHTWGPGEIGTCGSDGVSDTPQTNGSNGVCNLSKSTCDATLDNVENYMDYSFCSKMFTQGQATKMRAAAVNAMGGRSNIWTAANLQAVGVGVSSSLCSADFEATQTGLCSGNSTSFSLINTTATINTYAWTFTGGTPATSSAANPTVTYNTPGTYQVSLTITTSSGNRTITKASYITVAAGATTVALPITEGFVNTTFPPTNWSITNGGGTNTWTRNATIGTAPTAGNSARIDFYTTNTTGDQDDLNTPGFSLSGYSSANITFDVAYQPYNTTYFDKLEVLVSPGCGMPYEVVYSKQGTTLQTQAATQSAYTNPSTWRNESINLAPYLGNSQVSVKFRGISGYGNHLYLDNINISGTTGGGGATANFTPSTSSTCVGQTVTYTNTSAGATSWNWNFGTGATPATATGAGPHSVTYSSAGAKAVSLTVNGGSTSNQTVTVNALPTVSLGALPTVCVNSTPITLNQGSPAGGNYSGNGVSGNQFNPSTVGTHAITYTYTNASGCTNTATAQVVVDGCLSLTSEDINFDVYPNPTNGNVTISSSLAIDEIIVLDNVGRVVKIVAGEKATEMHLNLESLATGSYHIQTKFGATSKMTKLIVQ